MGKSSKDFSILLVVILSISSIILVESASAQSATKPTVPEFTLKYVDLGTYDVPPSTSPSTNPFTGETTNITISGYHVDNRTIELTIKNQQFTSYESNGQIINFFFNVRFKGYYVQNWTNLYYTEDYIVENYSSAYTKLSYSLGRIFGELNPKGQVDFQVQAFIGSIHRDASTFWAPRVFDGESSGWSNTQTVTIDETSASPNPTQTPILTQHPTINTGAEPPQTDSFPTATVLIVALLAMVVVLASSLLYQRNRKTAKTTNEAQA